MSQIIPSESDPLYKVSTVASMFDVSENTVRKWITDGTVRGTKIMGKWRIPQSECTRLANEEYGS